MLKQIQNSDYDRYLAFIFAEKEKQDDLAILANFNLELSRIKNKVSEPMLGLIRLQWWRETIAEIFDLNKNVRNQEIAISLRELVKRYPNLNQQDFITLIDAREKDFEQEPFPNYDDFKNYLLNSSAPLNRLVIQIISEETNLEIYNLSDKISEAWAFCAFMRSAYRNFGAGRCVFAKDIMSKYHLKMSDFGKEAFLNNSKKLVLQYIEEYEKQINSAIAEYNKLNNNQRKTLKPIYVFAELAQHNIKQIKKNDFDVFSKPINHYLGIFRLIKLYFG